MSEHADTVRLWRHPDDFDMAMAQRDQARRELERLRRAIARHRKEVQCCEECGDALVADARAKRKASADARLWALLNDEEGRS